MAEQKVTQLKQKKRRERKEQEELGGGDRKCRGEEREER